MTIFVAVPLGIAQTKDKDQPPGKGAAKDDVQDAPHLKRLQPLKSGYTRPGNPGDKMKDGKVIPVVWDDDYKGRIIGGTVYFAVFKNIGATDGEEHATNERDADGRRLWEAPLGEKTAAEGDETKPQERRSKDPHGECGNQLDLSG